MAHWALINYQKDKPREIRVYLTYKEAAKVGAQQRLKNYSIIKVYRVLIPPSEIGND